MHATYSVPDCNLSALLDAIAKLNKRAKRLGVVAIEVATEIEFTKARVAVLTVDGHINKNVWMLPDEIEEANKKWPHRDTGERMHWHKVTVTGEAPTLTDWEFVAVLEPMPTDDGKTLNLLRTLPGKTCPTEFRNIVGRCDHCKTHRRRNETFVVKHTSGDHKCVGRNCVKDFLNYHKDPHTLAEWAASLAELGSLCESAEDVDEDGYGSGGRSFPRCYSLSHFLTWTASRIAKAGWVSRSAARDYNAPAEATADVVLWLIGPPPMDRANRELWDKDVDLHTPDEKNEADADAAIAWAKEISESECESNEYLSNINLIARSGVVMRKTAGYAASIMTAHFKHLEREINRVKREARPESKHIGTVGERIKMLKVKCEKVIGHEGMYGITGIHKLTDENGSDLTWFASAGTDWLGEGESYTVAATVTKHDEYKGRKVTVINRVKILSEEEVEKEIKKAERAAKKLAKSAS